MNLLAVAANIEQELAELQKFTATPGAGVTRLPYTKEAKDACAYLSQLMTGAGLHVRVDNSGAVIGRLEGLVPETIMIGSHYDSVKHGGAYDGIAGVVCAIEAARALQRQQAQPYYSLEVIATNDEEGARFHAGLFTGKVLAGQLSVADIKALVDADGVSVYQAMADFGLQPEEIAGHRRTDISAFLEIHIEQGPVLEAAGKQLGIVDVIVGIKRALVTVYGQADHAGTMPMHMRKDALELAAKAISKIGDRARRYPGSVATVGFLQVEPNVMNIIPQQVAFTVDIRGVDAIAIQEQYEMLTADVQRLADVMQMKVTVEELLTEQPIFMDGGIKKQLEASCLRRGFSYMYLPSGAGHDAQIFGGRMPAAMLFVPSEGGRSHCPEERSSAQDLAAATQVLYDTLLALNEKRAFSE